MPRQDSPDCTAACTLCGRSRDMFGHLHLVQKERPDAMDFVMCLPCLSQLARYTRDARHAYERGGFYFDKFAHTRERRQPVSKVDMPPGLEQALREVMEGIEEIRGESDEETST